jgi:hypothetical protein
MEETYRGFEKLSDSEIRKGKELHPLEFGNLLFEGMIFNPITTELGLIYAYTSNKELFWTKI